MQNKKSKFLFISLLTLASLNAQAPEWIAGGEFIVDPQPLYAAYVSSGGTVSPLIDLPAGNGIIGTVDLNLSGTGIIGGYLGNAGYGAFTNPDGTLFPLTLGLDNGIIYGSAINDSGLALIVGATGSGGGYAAHATPSSATPVEISLPLSLLDLDTADINNAGLGVVGGIDGMALNIYAAFITSSGDLQPITFPSPLSGVVNSARINSSGKAIIAGNKANGDASDLIAPYAAFIFPDGTLTPIIQLATEGLAEPAFYGAAINGSGEGLIGGVDGTSVNAYAAYVAPDGTPTPFYEGSPFEGSINSVDLNDSGQGLLAGSAGDNMYAAFVLRSEAPVSIFTVDTPGSLLAAAISDAGVGLIGGHDGDSQGYLALVAPNGTLNRLSTPGVEAIYAVANGGSLLNATTPRSDGPYRSAIQTQLAAGAALENRFIQGNKLWRKRERQENERIVASNEEICQIASSPLVPQPVCKENSIWFEPFGALVYLNEDEPIPRYSNEVGGGLLGYERQGTDFLFGATFGYAFNAVHYGQSLGHGSVQEEMLSIYGSYYTDHFWIGAAAWGGLYQLKNERHTLATFTSIGKSDGWIFSPHLELATPWGINSCQTYFIEPFASFDWVANWQKEYDETGSSGLNLEIPKVDNSLLQSELGLRFYERFSYSCGELRLEEKVSYVNQAPFNVQSATTSFIASASSFPIATGSSSVENLGAAQIQATFVSLGGFGPYGGFSFQAMGNGHYQFYFGTIFAGSDF